MWRSRASRALQAVHVGSVALLMVAAPLMEARGEPVGPEGLEGQGAPEGRPSFALVIGVNASGDEGLPVLRYADDDAVLFHELFARLSIQSTLLATLDEATARLHPRAVEVARAPTLAAVEAAVAELAARVKAAVSGGQHPEVFVVYAGHGNVRAGEGYVLLEGARLSGAMLAKRVLAPLAPARMHVLIDACYAYFLAYPRGPGGERRPALSFHRVAGLLGELDVGLLLSSSSGRESHEWEGYQAGVFSHILRSGLSGAADVDGDQVVSYPEIAAFVRRAGSAIRNERYRPQLLARPPKQGDRLLALTAGRRLIVGRAEAGRYYLERADGTRLLDLHSSPASAVSVVLPVDDTVFIRRVADDRELRVEPAPAGDVALSELAVAPPRAVSRGAAHEAFQQLFTLPFSPEHVVSVPRELAGAVVAPVEVSAARPPGSPLRVWLGAGGIAASLGLGAGALAAVLDARTLRSRVADDSSNEEVSTINARIRGDNQAALVMGGLGGALLVAGATLLLWPEPPPPRVNEP